jgi:hypothetical protein
VTPLLARKPKPAITYPPPCGEGGAQRRVGEARRPAPGGRRADRVSPCANKSEQEGRVGVISADTISTAETELSGSVLNCDDCLVQHTSAFTFKTLPRLSNEVEMYSASTCSRLSPAACKPILALRRHKSGRESAA